MARITKIVRGGYRRHTVHDPVETTLGYVFAVGGTSYAQFDSYGRSTRDKPGKVSQSIQVDRDGAREIYELLKSAFPDLEQESAGRSGASDN
jgi:hypothetical protein